MVFRKALTSTLGPLKLQDLKAHTVLVPAFDLDSEATDEPRSWKMKFFHNLPNEDSDGHAVAVEVGLRTAAAPIYFPTSSNYIDGGVAANNPAMAALALAINQGGGEEPVPSSHAVCRDRTELQMGRR